MLRFILILVLCTTPGQIKAAFNVEITTTASSGGSFSAGVWTPTSSPSRINVGTLRSQLNAGDVIVTTGTTGAEAGDITVSTSADLDLLTTTSARTLTLRAADDVIINAPIAQTGGSSPNEVTLNFDANSDGSGGGAVTVSGNLNSGGGKVTATGAGYTLGAGRTIATGGSTFSIVCSGTLALGNSLILTSGGTANISTSGTGSVSSDILTSGGNLNLITDGNLTVSSGADLNATGGAGSGKVTVRSNAGLLGFTGNLTGGDVIHVMRGATGVLFQSGSQVSVSRLDVDATGTGNIEIRNLSSISLTHSGNFDTQNGDILLVAGSTFTTSVSSGLTLQARGTGGDVSIARQISLDDSAATLTITAQANVSATASLTTTNGTLALTGSNISLSAPISTNGGNLSANAGTGTLTLADGATVSTGGGTFLMSVANFDLSSPINTSGGNIFATASGTGIVANDITTSGGNLTINCTGNLTVTPGSQMNVSGGAGTGAINARSTAGTFDLQAGISGGTGPHVLAGHTGLLLKASFSVHSIDLDVTGTGNLTTQAGTTITVATSAIIDTANGDVLLNGNTNFGASGGTTTITARGVGGDVEVNAYLSCGAGGITFRADNDVVIGAEIESNGADLSFRSDLNNGGSGSIFTFNQLHSLGGDITMQGVDLSLSSLITTGGGKFNLTINGGSIANDIITLGGNLTVTSAGSVTTTPGTDLNATGGAGTGTLSYVSTSGKVTVGGTLSCGGNLVVSGSTGVVFNGSITGAGNVDVDCVTGNIAINSTASIVNSGSFMAFDAAISTITTAAGAVITPGSSSLLHLQARGNTNDLTINLPLNTGGGGLEIFSDGIVNINAAVSSTGPISLRADANADNSGVLFVFAPVTGTTHSVSLRGAGVAVVGAVDTSTGEIGIQPGAGNSANIAAALLGPSRLINGTTNFTNGSITGSPLTMNSGATLGFDNPSRVISPSAFSAANPLGETRIRLGGTAAGQFNRIVTADTFTAGGQLTAVLQPGFTPTAGMSFDILDFFTFAGSFTSHNLPALGTNLVWDTTQLATSGTLRVVTPVQLWRQQHFGTTLNSGNAANNADPDGDGVVNALEYALGTHPLSGGGNGLPTVGKTTVGGLEYLTLTVSRPVSTTDVSYRFRIGSTVQATNLGSLYSTSGDIPSNSFTTQVSRQPDGDREIITVRDNTPITGNTRRFMRLEVLVN
jgi:fibronectin-binding autotransporter adhesin